MRLEGLDNANNGLILRGEIDALLKNSMCADSVLCGAIGSLPDSGERGFTEKETQETPAAESGVRENHGLAEIADLVADVPIGRQRW